MHSVVSHAASHEALAKLSEEVCALGAKLDHARSCADSRTLSTLETRIAMLAEQLQARDRNDPNVSDELKVLIERLIERIDRMELTSATSPRPPALRTWSRNWSRSSTPAMPVSIDSQRSKAHSRSCSSISDTDRCRFSAKIPRPHPPWRRCRAMLPTSGKRRSRPGIRSKSLTARWHTSWIG